MISIVKKIISISRYPEFAKLLIWRTYTPWRLRSLGVVIGDNVSFLGTPIVSMAANSSIRIAEKANICSVPQYTALGVNHASVLRTVRTGASIHIGKNTGISGGSICAAVAVSIGDECLIGANVTITDSDFHPIGAKNRRYNNDHNDIQTAAVSIKDNVFIGTGAIILKGVTIGKNSVIGAGSVVTRSFPENSIVAGNPAKIIGSVRE